MTAHAPLGGVLLVLAWWMSLALGHLAVRRIGRSRAPHRSSRDAARFRSVQFQRRRRPGATLLGDAGVRSAALDAEHLGTRRT